MKPSSSDDVYDMTGMSSTDLQDEIKRLRHQLDVNRV
jgi:biotin operon repressor